MSQLHYFIDPGNNNDQILQHVSEQYGPIDESEYRTNALFTIGSDRDAFAVCSGNFLIFDNDHDSSLVNFIIQTNSSNAITPDFFTPKVKYFVYRGLRRDSFMIPKTGGGYELISENDAISQNNEFLIYLYNKHKKEKEKKELVLSDIYVSETAETSLYNIFLLKNKRLEQGKKIGIYKKMDGYSPGFGVVLDFMPIVVQTNDFNFAKTDDHKIRISFDDNSTPGNESRQINLTRENIHGFLDPAVFWSLQFKKGIKFKNQNYNLNTDSNSEIFYNKFINFFETKNKLYLDIRNFLDYSLNYFKDQDFSGKNISYSINDKNIMDTVFVEHSYYTNFWPIKILDISPISNSNYTILNLELFVGDFVKPIIYLDYGIVAKSCVWDGGFSNALLAKRFELAKSHDQKFINRNLIQIILPCVKVGSNYAKLPWISKLYYFDGQINHNAKYHKTPFDYLFGGITRTSVGGYKYSTGNLGDKVYKFGNQRKICIPEGSGVSFPFVAQTKIGLSQNSIIFYAEVISEDLAQTLQSKTQIPKSNLVHNGQAALKINQETRASSYRKIEDTSGSVVIYQEKPMEFQLCLSSDDILDIQETIIENENILQSALNNHYHELRFVFEPFSKEDFKYGKSILKLKGLKNDGNEVIISNLSRPSSQLFIRTIDQTTFSSIEISNANSDFKDYLDDNPYPEYPVTTLITQLEKTHSRYLNQQNTSNIDIGNYLNVRDFITIWRRYYYGAFDNSAKGFKGFFARKLNFEPFEMVVPNAFEAEKYSKTNFDVFQEGLDDATKKEVNDYLFSSANENLVRDNPSPYIIDTNSIRIDLGHLLYGLDALINNYNSTHKNYTLFSLNSSIDFAGYLGDFTNAASESRLYSNGFSDRFKEFYHPEENDISRFYDIDAPDADLYSDIDAFGMFNVYKYFIEHSDSPLIPMIKGKRIITIDFLFKYYYNPSFNSSDSTSFPIDANYKLRMLNFCRGFTKKDDLNSISSSTELIFQGFVEQDNITQKYIWVADTLNENSEEHPSLVMLRTRAEAFAHFWYQFQYSKHGVAKVLLNGEYFLPQNTYYPAMNNIQQNITLGKSIRFEKNNKFSLKKDLSDFIENYPNTTQSYQTSSSELDYVLNRFLSFIKDKFQIEKNINQY